MTTERCERCRDRPICVDVGRRVRSLLFCSSIGAKLQFTDAVWYN